MIQFKYGSTFKSIRVKKGFSMKETAAGIITTQSLRNFEKGLSDTTLTTFLSLLERIFVTWQEFIRHHEHNILDNLEEFDCTLNRLLLNNDYYDAKQLSKQMLAQYEATHSIVYYHLNILIRSLIFLADFGDCPSQKELTDVKAHLNRVTDWSEYENYLFGKMLYFFSVEEVNFWHRRPLKKMFTNSEVEDNAVNTPMRLMLSITNFYIRHQKFEDGLDFIKLVEKNMNLPNDHLNLFHKILFKYNKGLILIALNDKEGLILCQSCIDVLNQIGDYKITINNLYSSLRAISKYSSLDVTI